MKCPHCGAEMPKKVKTIRLGSWEYETKTHDFNKCLKDINIPEGWELWDMNDCVLFHNELTYRKELNLEDCWFFIKQPFGFNMQKGYVAVFDADSDRTGFSCNGSRANSDDSLGVRFKRKVRK